MKTASWQTYRGEGRVGISLGTPRGQPAGFRLYRLLAPSRDMLAMPQREYVPRFRQQLADLDAGQVWNDLHALARGAEPVLLCFEKPPFNAKNWCHRRLVAHWFEQQLGHAVAEIDYDGTDGFQGYEASRRLL